MTIELKDVMLTGGKGFLGSYVTHELLKKGCNPYNISHDLYELTCLKDVIKAFKFTSPDIVIHLAAIAGGIGLNMAKPATLFLENLLMGTYMMDTAYKFGVKKYVSIGTVCSYPKFTPVPFKEDDIWNGYPEETNAPYGLAKKMQLVQAQSYRKQYGFNAIHLIPVNLYGPGDNFDPDSSHVIPALIKKVDYAKKNNEPIVIWGTGTATREFLYVEDCAKAIVMATEKYNEPDPVNIGTGNSISIYNLVHKISDMMEFKGDIEWDVTKPDGQPARQLDTSRAKNKFGFVAETSIDKGLEKTIEWYYENMA